MKKVDYEHFGRFVYPFNLSCKGNDLYFCVKRADFDDNDYKSDLYQLRDGIHKQLTTSGDISAYYLLDDCIVFSSLRSDKDKDAAKDGKPLTVLHALDYDGGEAREIARIDVNVSGMQFFSRDRFFFTGAYSHELARAFANHTDEQKAMLHIKEDADYQVIDELPFWLNGTGYTNKVRTRLYLCDQGGIRPVTDEFTNVDSMVLSPDKRTLVYVATTYSDKTPIFQKLYKLDTDTMETVDISLVDRAIYNCVYFFNDAELLIGATDCLQYGINQNPNIYRCNLDTHSLQCLYDQGEHSMFNAVGTDIKAARTLPAPPLQYENFFYFISTVDDSAHLMRLDLTSGDIVPVTWQRGTVNEAVLYDGGFAAIAMRDINGCELYRIDRDGNEKLMSAWNIAVVSAYFKSKVTDVYFDNENGVQIHGFVLAPIDMKKGEKYPTILNIHGGPKTVYGSVYYHEMQLWANKGYAVIFCNPTGSDGKGNGFADIRGKYGTIDYKDILAFCDECIATFGFIDKDRIGVTGGSYGGFMTNWIIGHTNRFAAAVSQRSISNFTSFAMLSDIGFYFAHDQLGGATMWTDMEAVWEQSPLRYADRVQTPTLFIHADADYRCPGAEGMQMFAALKYHDVPARLCLFRGEDHELSRSGKPRHRVRRLREITAWFDTYLKPE